MKRQRKRDNLIEIPEEVRIPGTDVILESGDKVEVLNEAIGSEKRIQAFLEVLRKYYSLGDVQDIGYMAATELMQAATRMGMGRGFSHGFVNAVEEYYGNI